MLLEIGRESLQDSGHAGCRDRVIETNELGKYALTLTSGRGHWKVSTE